MDKKNKLGLQYDSEGEKMVSQQLSESYQSGVVDAEVENQRRSRKSSKRS